jgi:quercetin dioxygenase-like cupin family protein
LAGRSVKAGRLKKSGRAMLFAFAPNEKHWHGARLTKAMTHITIQEVLDGKVVDWMEKVSDEK